MCETTTFPYEINFKNAFNFFKYFWLTSEKVKNNSVFLKNLILRPFKKFNPSTILNIRIEKMNLRPNSFR